MGVASEEALCFRPSLGVWSERKKEEKERERLWRISFSVDKRRKRGIRVWALIKENYKINKMKKQMREMNTYGLLFFSFFFWVHYYYYLVYYFYFFPREKNNE